MKFKKISTRITVAIIGVAILISLLISIIVGSVVNNTMTKEGIEKAELIVGKNTKEFDQQFNKIRISTETLSESLKSEFNIEQAKNEPLYIKKFNENWFEKLSDMAPALNYSDSIYVYFNSEIFNVAEDTWLLKDETGKFVKQDMLALSYYDGDTVVKEWFYGPINSQEAIWTAPYISESGDLITSYVTPVIIDGESVAIIGMDLELNDISEYLNNIELYETGYLYMMDQDYNFIVHPELEMGTNLGDYPGGNDIVDLMKDSNYGNAIIKKDGNNKISAYDRLENGWIISSSIPLEEVTALVGKILIQILLVGGFSLVLATFIAIFVGRSISKPIQEVTRVIEYVRNGDFTKNATVKSSDETKLLADGLNEMILSTRELIKNTQNVSINMSNAASTLASMAEETSATSDEVARTISEIAKGSTEQAIDAESGTVKARDLDSVVQDLLVDSDTMTEFAETAITVSK